MSPLELVGGLRGSDMWRQDESTVLPRDWVAEKSLLFHVQLGCFTPWLGRRKITAFPCPDRLFHTVVGLEKNHCFFMLKPTAPRRGCGAADERLSGCAAEMLERNGRSRGENTVKNSATQPRWKTTDSSSPQMSGLQTGGGWGSTSCDLQTYMNFPDT